jgi:uncharacterized membrane protein
LAGARGFFAACAGLPCFGRGFAATLPLDFGAGFLAGFDAAGLAFAGKARVIFLIKAVYLGGMTAGNEIDAEVPPILFSARLMPHKSLSHTGFLVLMGFLSAVSFAAGIAFLLMGAWPVFGFLGLDVLAIWWAFRVNYHRGQAVEEITVTPFELRVRRISPRGQVSEWVLNPLWVQLTEEAHAEFGIERLYLVSRGRRLSVASFLGADEKASFAKALMAALQAARRGPTYPSIA